MEGNRLYIKFATASPFGSHWRRISQRTRGIRPDDRLLEIR